MISFVLSRIQVLTPLMMCSAIKKLLLITCSALILFMVTLKPLCVIFVVCALLLHVLSSLRILQQSILSRLTIFLLLAILLTSISQMPSLCASSRLFFIRFARCLTLVLLLLSNFPLFLGVRLLPAPFLSFKFFVMFRDNPSPVNFARCLRRADEEKVIPHLAYSLSDVDRLVKEGRPISSNSIQGMYYDGETGEPQLTFDQLRGVDLNDCWNHEQTKSKIRRRFGVPNLKVGSASDGPKKGAI